MKIACATGVKITAGDSFQQEQVFGAEHARLHLIPGPEFVGSLFHGLRDRDFPDDLPIKQVNVTFILVL